MTAAKLLAFLVAVAAILGPGSDFVKNVRDLNTSPSPSTTTTAAPTPSETSTPVELAARYDKKNPTECSLLGDASPLDTFTIHQRRTNRPIATVEVRHSAPCNTSWVRVINQLEGTTVNKVIERAATAGLPKNRDETEDKTENIERDGNKISYGRQLYAPDCVSVMVVIKDGAGILVGELPLRQVCK
jgi:hypothetical protein